MENNRKKLGTYVDVTRGMSLPGANYAEEGKYIRLTLGNFNEKGGFKINCSKTNIYYKGKVKPEYILKKGDIITPLTEQTYGLLGATARIPEDDKYIQSQDIGLIKCLPEKIDPSFCYYLISSPMVRKQLSAAAQQTKIRHTSPDKIKNVTIIAPSYTEQVKIGRFLDVITSKIELNNKINAELEKIAKTLYYYWFVQFDFPDENNRPYKSSGGAMVYNEELKREIPKGWEVKSLYEIAEYTNGLACQNYRPVNGEFYNVIKIKEMHEGFSCDTEHVRIDVPKKYIVENGDILFSWSATLEIQQWIGGKGVLNQHIFKVTSNHYPKSFYYFEIKNYINVFKRIAETRKTTMGHITIDHLKQAKIIIPPSHLIKKLDTKITPVFYLSTKLKEENQRLMRIRDFLLPMLMNGQVKVI